MTQKSNNKLHTGELPMVLAINAQTTNIVILPLVV
uniref:Uncharacterized protein n=1 Tax=Arundo donax TaxID=35708 RepID=A0A0A9FD72_ARUDO